MIKRLARWKIYVDRARWYLVFIQFFIIVLIYLNTSGMKLYWWHYPLIIIMTIAGQVFAGFLDRKIGLIREEQRFYSTENPISYETLEKVKKILEKMK